LPISSPRKSIIDCDGSGLVAALERRLSSLYDMRIGGDIGADVFVLLKAEYQHQIPEISSALKLSRNINLRLFTDGCKIFEFSNQLFPTYSRSVATDKARALKPIVSNHVQSGQTACVTYVKPLSL
jgi:hypothetical protein